MLFVGPGQRNGIAKFYKKASPVFVLAALLGFCSVAQAESSYTSCTTPTIDTSAYIAGDDIGGLQTATGVFRAGVNSAMLQNIMVGDEGAEGKQIEICFFNANPTGTTVTDQAALAIADADLAKVAGCTTISEFSSFSDNGIGQAKNVGMVIKAATPNLYFAVVAREGVTYDSADSLKVCLTFIQD